jgi:glycosyltransferase involved in cell wall biosynthesis
VNVSVVIPVFNRAWCIESAIQSALATGVEGLEIIVVDDGSTDETQAILSRLAGEGERRVRVLCHPDGKNHGIAASRNLGVREATGRFITFLDSDDLYLPNRFATALAWLEGHPSAEAAIEPYEVVSLPECYVAPRLVTHLTALGRERKREETSFLREMLFQSMYWSMPVITLRRSTFNRFGGFSERLSFAEETALWLKLAAAEVVGIAQNVEPVAQVRRHSDHSWEDTDVASDRMTHLTVLLEAYRWVRQDGGHETAEELFRERLPAYVIEILADRRLSVRDRVGAWIRLVASDVSLASRHAVLANLLHVPNRRQEKRAA